MGIPVVGCHCPVCRSPSPRNKRLRPSLLLTIDHLKLLIDPGPDFRTQALRYNIDELSGVLFTHAHYDHTAGIDELRIFTLRNEKPLPCLLSPETLEELSVRFYYIFTSNGNEPKSTTNLAPEMLPGKEGSVRFLDVPISYTSYLQGGMKVNAFRFGDLAYVTDIKTYDDSLFARLAGVKYLIISALRYSASPLHFSVDDAIDFSRRVGAESTQITHIAHELDHDKTNAYLPPEIRLSYDGMELDFTFDEII